MACIDVPRDAIDLCGHFKKVLILFKVNCLKITFLENILTAIILFLVVVKSEVPYFYFVIFISTQNFKLK